jgi:hypothetical protein
MSFQQLIATERARFERAPMSQLRSTRLALSIHAWGNTTEEKARKEAIEAIIHARLRAKRKP